jgi:hypothetical protein
MKKIKPNVVFDDIWRNCFNCAPHFDYRTTFTPWLNQAYLVDFQSDYVRSCSHTVDPFCIFKKGSPVGNPVGVQTRTFSESKEQKKVCKSTTYTLFEQLRTVSSGERGEQTYQSTLYKTRI